MVTVRLTGTVRYRTRIRILWFWAVQPWRTEQVSESWDFEVGSARVVFGLGPWRGVLSYMGRNLQLVVGGIPVALLDIPVGGLEAPIKAEPVKGVRLDLVLSVSV